MGAGGIEASRAVHIGNQRRHRHLERVWAAPTSRAATEGATRTRRSCVVIIESSDASCERCTQPRVVLDKATVATFHLSLMMTHRKRAVNTSARIRSPTLSPPLQR